MPRTKTTAHFAAASVMNDQTFPPPVKTLFTSFASCSKLHNFGKQCFSIERKYYGIMALGSFENLPVRQLTKVI